MAKKPDYRALVLGHYKKEAVKHGIAAASTINDLTTRELEIKVLLSYLKNDDTCLEVGCGNGSASIRIAELKSLKMNCIDFSPDLIALAKRQSTKKIKGSITFKEQDIIELDEKNKYSAVFTERCIINLLSWEDQKNALSRMVAALKKNGRLLLLEAYGDGLQELNRAREELGLSAIPPAYHNLHLDKEKVIEFLAGKKMKFISEDNFLSSYYFGSRVLYPALAKAAGKDIAYNNVFGRFFAALPAIGNFSHIKLLAFKKQ